MPSKKKSSKGRTKKSDVDSQMKRLQIDVKNDDDALLEEAMKLAAVEQKEFEEEQRKNCKHGYTPSPSNERFVRGLMDTFIASIAVANSNGEEGISAMIDAIRLTQEKLQVSRRQLEIKHEMIISYCVGKGTEHLLNSDGNDARTWATYARFFFTMQIRRILNIDPSIKKLRNWQT